MILTTAVVFDLIGLLLIDLLIDPLFVPRIDPRMIDVIGQLMDLLA